MYRATPQPTPKQRGRYRLHHPAGVEAVTRRRVGDPNPRGRLERNVGVFRLRAGLSAPGEIAVADAAALVEADWWRQVDSGSISASIIEAYARDLAGLVAVMGVQEIAALSDITPNMLRAWCRMPSNDGTPSAENSWYRRRSALRSFYETARCLGITDTNPAKSVEFPRRSGRFVNAFDDLAIAQLKRISRSTLGDTRLPCSLALMLCGASTRELASITVDDVDLAGQRVWLHGGGYRCRDRWVPFLDDWCAEAITQRVTEQRASLGDAAGAMWLVYRPHPKNPTPFRQPEAASSLITGLLKKARVHVPGQTRAESIREWLAAKIFEDTGSVEQVAIRLGLASLDTAAHVVGYDWIEQSGLDLDPPDHRRTDEAQGREQGDEQGAKS